MLQQVAGAAVLRERGVGSTAVLLPSCGETGGTPGASGPGLAEDAAEVRRALAGTGPAVVVGHSYGGVVATEAVRAGDATHLLYVTSALPGTGEALADFGGDEAEAVAGAFARLTRQSAAAVTQPVGAAAWRHVPSTYLVCAEDRATPPQAQPDRAWRAGRVLELPAGHHPFLSHPEQVAEVVLSCG